MDERARIPVTLPRAHPTKPFWQDPPDADVADLRSTPELLAAADIVIVGSGITGASIAYHLQLQQRQQASSKTASVLMLEARQACSGATGRNGGHTKAASYRSFRDHAAALGVEAAVQIARLELAAIQGVHRLAGTLPRGDEPSEDAVECDSHPCDTLDVVYDPTEWAQAQEAVAAMQAAMPAGDPAAAYTLYSRDEALAQFPCSDHVDAATGAVTLICGVVRYPAGSVSAYRFTVGIVKRCLAKGLNLQTNTPVVKIEKHRDGWTVVTDRGAVSARHVVLATNGYTAHLVPALQGVVVPLRGQITMHRPGSKMPGGGAGGDTRDKTDKTALETTYSFIYDQGYEYMVARPPGSTCAGDIVMGGGLKFADTTKVGGAGTGGLCEYGSTDDTTLNPTVSAYLRETPIRYFGQGWGGDHPDGRVRAEWTGIMGYTPDGYPLVGEMPSPVSAGADNSGLWLCCAFQGHGMAYSWPCGQALAAMIQSAEVDDEAKLQEEDAALRQWFPDCFRVTEARLNLRFAGRLH
ncbi:FAD dependent oxidoreductase family protein [Sporothrix schenckii 1099-18]|uniref:FAD dependent oxidoreductase domain-containing protein n=2 Tax=Sporothrix schenckii TaxID=29908 RepID=U7PNE9_SPOS1|nr:FAD dependent oxidoreductase family protein [Sporothrix schenckii 1099-18]ERS97112.1 hypothetical protein HMPREF1624_06442 [Sporothrix schenckii ATCC 58251]KJR86321.1 FAD dependent oxidoreductase family protein [Sporothrix schenckii 1099-18]